MFAARPLEPSIHVRASVPLLTRFESKRVKTALREAIGGFESRIERLDVDLEPRGRHSTEAGIRCHVTATLTEAETVVVTCTASSLAAACDAAARSIELALCRRLGGLDPMVFLSLNAVPAPGPETGR